MKRKEFLRYGTTGMASIILGLKKGYSFNSINQGDNTDLISGQRNNFEIVTGKAMICTSQPLATATGYDILKAGGNAIDAAIAANAMLCLTEPMMCGPGGDLFAIIWKEDEKKLYGLNASGRSPYNWSIEQAKSMGLKQIPFFGPLSWSVPGCVSGWAALSEKFGTKPISELFEPVINYAKDGFPVSRIASTIWHPESGVKDFNTLEGTYFFNGRGLEYGEFFKNKSLANFFTLLSADGFNSFYEGEIADRIIRFSIKHGGRFEKKDFLDHRSNWINPVKTNYRGYDIWELPPNGQGLAVLQMLNIIENFDLASMKANSAEWFHLFIEAKKLAFEDRAVYYADTDFAKVPVDTLLSKSYAESRAKLINLKKALPAPSPGKIQNSSETIYLTVADEQGNMVSLIQSLNSPWGSHYMIDELGFCLQNRGYMFSLNEKALNKLEPHKRPFHTIIPAFVTKNNNPVFSFGVTGGDYQPQGQVQILSNIIDYDMTAQEAGDHPRLWHRESSEPTGLSSNGVGKIILEPEFSIKVKQNLEKMGHLFSKDSRYFGGYQGIWKNQNTRCYFSASDFRKDSLALGY